MIEELRFYNVMEVAEILKVTRRSVYRYLKSGDLKAVKIGKEWKISEPNLKAFASRGTYHN